jgi:hypothetical protein
MFVDEYGTNGNCNFAKQEAQPATKFATSRLKVRLILFIPVCILYG